MSKMKQEINNVGWAGELAGETRLSLREAELYVLHVEQDQSLSECAPEMDVEEGTIYSTWARVKRKIREARKTAMLEIPDE